jgi:hypothetical protein
MRIAPLPPLVLALWLATTAPVAAAPPVSSHAQVYTCCTPEPLKERLFAESKAMGARFIRVDVEMGPIFAPFGTKAAQPEWSGLDAVMELSRRERLPVLGVIRDVPRYLSSCPERWPDSGRCPPTDPAEFGALAGEIAAHARGTIDHWEILNEPDGAWAFEGGPEDYARMLSASYDAIKAKAPGATVVMGGIMRPQDPAWFERVLATPGADAAHKFDVANLHLRGGVVDGVRRVAEWRGLLARYGFSGPVWVTELGYPGDPSLQREPGYTGGEDGQAAFLTESVVALAEAGVPQVFVTLRDSPGGAYASEGVAHIDETPGYAVRRKPAFEAMRRLSDEWDQIVAWRSSQRWHEQQQVQHEQSAAVWRRDARAARLKLRDAREAAGVLAARALGGRGRSARGARVRRVSVRGASGAVQASAGACANALLSGRRHPSARARAAARDACDLRVQAQTYKREWQWSVAMTDLERQIALGNGQAAAGYAKLVRGR